MAVFATLILLCSFDLIIASSESSEESADLYKREALLSRYGRSGSAVLSRYGRAVLSRYGKRSGTFLIESPNGKGMFYFKF